MTRDERQLTTGERNRSLAAIIGCISVVGVTFGLAPPLMSLIMEREGLPRLVIGLNATMPALAMLVFSPLIPAIVRTVGLKRFLFACIAVEAAMFALIKASGHVGWWFPIRFVMGASGTGIFIAAETWINQIAETRTRGRLIAIYGSSLAGGFALGPIVIIVTGIDGWAPFLVGTVVTALGAVPLLFIGNLAPSFAGRSSFRPLAFFRLAPTIASAVLVFAMIEAVAGALLAVYGVRSGLSEADSALLVTITLVGTLVMQVPVGWLADRIDRRTLLLWCAFGTVIGAALLPFVIFSEFWRWPSLLLWGGSAVAMYNTAVTILGDRYRGADLITANAAIGIIFGLGSVTGPIVAGGAMDLWDPHGLPLVLGAASGGFLLLWWAQRLTRAA